MPLQVFAVVRDFGQMVRFNMMQGERECHVAVPVVVPVGFTVGCDVGQLRPVAPLGVGAEDSLGELFAVAEELLKGHGARNGPVVEENLDRPPGRQAQQVGHGRVDAGPTHVPPGAAADFPHTPGLMGREQGEANPQLHQDLERFQIDCRFR